MDKQYFSIGEMAAINHISIKTLRLYDEAGILKPAYTNPETGYRYYTLQQTARLDMIAYMRELGMKLSEIGKVLEKEDLALVESILAEKAGQLEADIALLKDRQDAVTRAIASIERYRKSPATGVTSLEYIEKRCIWHIPCKENFYEKDQDSYEGIVMSLRQALMKAGVPQIHTYNLGTSIRQADFEAGRLIADKVFIFSDSRLKRYPGTCSELDSGMHACIYLDSYDEEKEGAGKLLAFCREHGYNISGDYLCEELTEFNAFDASRRNMFLRLQVPVYFHKNL